MGGGWLPETPDFGVFDPHCQWRVVFMDVAAGDSCSFPVASGERKLLFKDGLFICKSKQRSYSSCRKCFYIFMSWLEQITSMVIWFEGLVGPHKSVGPH